MKRITALLMVSALSTGIMAQGVFSNRANGALEKVIRDFPNQFKNIRGELLASGGKLTAYKSVVSIPGSISTTITLYKGTGKTLADWTATVFASTGFDEASKKFKELYGELKNTIIKIEGEKPVILNGRYETPAASRQMNSVLFDILPATEASGRIRVELMLTEQNKQWEVILSVYDKDINEAQSVVANTER
jgi:hypothetical protein